MLTYIRDVERRTIGKGSFKHFFALYKCDCGKEIVIRKSIVTSGNQRSCGCTKNKKHGHSRDRLYTIWIHMKKRCNDKTHKQYKMYGEKGIKVCQEWDKNIKSFIDWAMSNGYKDNLTLDRTDNEKGYTPDNCRWVGMDVQAMNRGKPITNKSGYKGVYYKKDNRKWCASISYYGITKFLGYFDTPEEGGIAYNNFVISNNLPHPLNKIDVTA